MKPALFFSTSAVVTLLSPLLMGQERPVSVALSLSSLVSDNARKSSDETLSERQDIYQLAVLGVHQNSYMTSSLNYSARARQFDKASQEAESYVDGRGSLQVGQVNHPVALHINHVRKRLLDSQDALDITENREERDILSIAPEVRIGSISSDRIFVQGQFNQIRFTENKRQNADTEGAVLMWSRPLSPISVFNVSTQYSTTEFLYLPDLGYEYTRADFSYQKALRMWNYHIRTGYNQSQRQEILHESPILGLDIGVNVSRTHITLSASSQITDTATGSGMGDSIGNDGLGRVPEQINREQFSVSWNSMALCDRCTLFLNMAFMRDNFLEKEIQSDNSQYGARLSYSLSTRSSLEWRYYVMALDYSGSDHSATFAGGQDYEYALVSMTYRYSLANQMTIELFVRQEKREQPMPVRMGYSENIIGSTLTFKF